MYERCPAGRDEKFAVATKLGPCRAVYAGERLACPVLCEFAMRSLRPLSLGHKASDVYARLGIRAGAVLP
jgi:hypothetical protein